RHRSADFDVTSGFGAAIGVAAVYLVVLLAPFVAPYDPATQHREHPLAPPAIRVTDGDPHVHLLGTDSPGRDQFSRLVYGGRISLGAGVLAAALALGAGLLFGSVAGFFGGWIDTAVMGASDVFLALPWLYLLLAVRAALPLDLDPARALLAIVIVIGIAGWARPARLVRGVVLSVRSRDFVAAAAASGASPARVLRSHVVPEAFSVALTQASILIPQYTLAEITLSFFGVGVGEPTPSWGTMMGAMLRQD